MDVDLDASFPRLAELDAAVPAWCVTPREGRTVHRFFDTSPFSPSGRYLGLTRLPYEDRLPEPGDAAEVLLVDLLTGRSRVVAETRGWDIQVGAHVQWGVDDSELFFNDVDVTTWRPYGCKLDLERGKLTELEGTVYAVSPDGRYAASPDLLRIGATQAGYGVAVPNGRRPVNRGAPSDDGVYVTDTRTGTCRLVASLRDLVERAGASIPRRERETGEFYAFHVKWSPLGDRLLLVLRWLARERPRDGRPRRAQLLSMRADGSEVRVAVPAAAWDRGGHHPNWCPDGEHVLMNLRLDGRTMRFVRVRHDGEGLRELADGVIGSGHPTLHPDGRHLLTDAYPHEPVASERDAVPLRWIELPSGAERTLAQIPVGPGRGDVRVDPHPAWDERFRLVAFNAFLGGTRRVCVVDLAPLLR